MLYPEHVIQEIREKSDIVSIISEYTTLQKRGSAYTGLCPFHHEKTPSFSVSEDKQLYYCFGCGAGGNVITFLMQKENMSFVETVKCLAEKIGIKLDEHYLSEEEIEKNKRKQKLLEILKESARFFHFALRDERNADALAYLTGRGIQMETIKQFGLGYAPSEYNALYQYLSKRGYSDELILESGLCLRSKKGMIYDRFASRIIYPIFDITKKVIAFGGRVMDGSLPKYLNSPENILFNKSNTLYGLQFAKQSGSSYFILVEGYMDVIAMHQAGITQTVASLGTAFTVLHAKLLKRYTKEVVILYDSDGAGQKAALRAIPILKSVGLKIKVVQLKEGKDPDEFLKVHGKEEMLKEISEAPSDIWFRIKHIEKNYALSNPEQKIQFLQEVAILLAESTSSIEQAIYQKEICEIYQIDEAAFKAELQREEKRMAHPARQEETTIMRQHTSKHALDNEAIFLAVLYHYPSIGSKVAPYIKVEMFEEGLMQDLASAVLSFILDKKEVDMSHFSVTYPEIEAQNVISHVMIYKDQRYEDLSMLHKMVVENVKRLTQGYIEKRLKVTKDVNEVQNLLFQKKELAKLNIDFING